MKSGDSLIYRRIIAKLARCLVIPAHTHIAILSNNLKNDMRYVCICIFITESMHIYIYIVYTYLQYEIAIFNLTNKPFLLAWPLLGRVSPVVFHVSLNFCL